MICSRSLALLLTLLSLVACDQPPVPQPAPQPKPPKTESVKPPPAAPVVQKAEPAPAKPVMQVPQPPAPKPQPVAKPAVTAAPAPAPVVKPQPKPKPKPKPLAVVTKPAAPEFKAPLDLSLPGEVFEPLQPLEPLDDSPATLLPPLFVEKTEQQSPFQLNGKLITNERSDDYWDSLEGAELQFEFKR